MFTVIYFLLNDAVVSWLDVMEIVLIILISPLLQLDKSWKKLFHFAFWQLQSLAHWPVIT